MLKNLSKINPKRIIPILLILILILNSIVLIDAQTNENKIAAVYFTSLHCPNCAYTDPEVLGKWPQQYNNLVIIEYVFETWTDENAQLLGQYSKNYNSMAAIPNIFINENENYLGKINVIEANKEFESLSSNPVLLLKNSISFNELNLNELPANPTIWVNNRVLIRTDNQKVSSDFLKELLFSKNLTKTIQNSNYKITNTNPEPLPISNGEIIFEQAINIEDSWILEFNDKADYDLPTDNQSSKGGINLPLIGKIDVEKFSLPLITILIGLADGFNPCAFFILTFLLATMLYASAEIKGKKEKRIRLAIVGGIFIFFSGLVYFMFMSLWLNVFLFAKQIILLTFIAGCIALFAGIINIKDYFYFQKGLSLTLPKKEKIRFVDKVEKLTKVKSLWALIIGTIIIAATVNLYELLCTVGFPMVYLGTLATKELSSLSYYLYILLYNFCYIIPLITIVSIFVITLGSKEFSKKNVQRLKLISGLMVLFLGLILIFKPALLERLITPFLAIAAALAISLGIIYHKEFRKKQKHPDFMKEIEEHQESKKEEPKKE